MENYEETRIRVIMKQGNKNLLDYVVISRIGTHIPFLPHTRKQESTQFRVMRRKLLSKYQTNINFLLYNFCFQINHLVSVFAY